VSVTSVIFGKTIGTVPNMTLVADTDTYACAEFVSEKQ